MGAWTWGDTDGYFGNTMTGEEFRPILGVTKMYQVEEAVKMADIVLTAEEIDALEAASDKSGVDSIQFWESRME